jgi:hypothetical protein
MNTEQNEKPAPPSWAALLKSALEVPGKLSTAFRAFHKYSIGNQVLAMEQCLARRIQIGPISTFMDWKNKGRFVKKGEKAIVLCMPITRKKTKKDAETGEQVEDGAFTMFVYKPHWFVYSQTEGEEVQPEPIPGWDQTKALDALQISEAAFEEVNGNVLGYAKERKIAINPIAPADEKPKVLFHELAHIVLGHCDKGSQSDSRVIGRNLAEAEAEAVTLIMLETLGMSGVDECRGYIQNWYKASDIPEKSAQRIFKAADKILKAGQ